MSHTWKNKNISSYLYFWYGYNLANSKHFFNRKKAPSPRHQNIFRTLKLPKFIRNWKFHGYLLLKLISSTCYKKFATFNFYKTSTSWLQYGPLIKVRNILIWFSFYSIYFCIAMSLTVEIIWIFFKSIYYLILLEDTAKVKMLMFCISWMLQFFIKINFPL